MRSVPRDFVLAVVAVVVLQFDFWVVEGVPPGTAGSATVLSALVFGASLRWRRSRPELMVALACLALAGGAALDGILTETLTVAACAMAIVFSSSMHLDRRASAWAAVAFLLATWADLVLARSPDPLLSDLAFTSLIVVPGPYLAGRALRDRRRRTEELERLDERLREEQDQRARMAVLDERARIAREMHDVVAHSVSLMVVQTGAARALLDEDPERARGALLAVEDAGRSALAELRRAIAVMRGAERAADLAPQPGLAEIEALVERARRTGLSVDLEVSGEPRPLPAGADLAAYRIVQEALTNTVRHAGPASATVALRWEPGELQLEIADTGTGPNDAVAPGSHGLVGMRERAAAYGGRVETGPGAEGGYRVRARLPLEAA